MENKKINKKKLYQINTKINKLKIKNKLTEKEKIKLARLYSDQCTEEIYLGIFCGKKD